MLGADIKMTLSLLVQEVRMISSPVLSLVSHVSGGRRAFCAGVTLKVNYRNLFFELITFFQDEKEDMDENSRLEGISKEKTLVKTLLSGSDDQMAKLEYSSEESFDQDITEVKNK